MKLNFSGNRVLAVVAHPDDAELLCAGTLARAKADGAKISVCVLCNGDKGQPSKPVKNLAAVRKKEMEAASRILGAEIFFGGISDATLTDDKRTRELVTEILRQFRPTLVMAHATEDYHPDHQAAAKLAEAASWFCASRGFRTKSPATSEAPALWWMDTINMSGFLPDFFVDVSAFAKLKLEMLMCHKTQLARGDDKDFSPLAELMQLQMKARGTQAGVKAAEAFRAHHAFKRTCAW
jgi:LmbE family N-acetylglucosaminyl deacetylase